MCAQGKVPAEATPGKTPHFPQIDAIKGVAIILVMIYHAGGVMNWPNILHGEVGVDLFLLVSGVLLSLNSAGLTRRQFITRRLFRIYPAYWIALALFVWGGGALLREQYQAADIFVQLIGLHATWKGAYHSPINDSFWYISTILALYATFLIIRKRTGDALFLFGLGGLSTALALVPAPGFGHLAPRLPLFFVGIAIGHHLKHGTLLFRTGWLFAAGMVTAAIIGWARGLEFKYLVSGAGIAGGTWWLHGALERNPVKFIISSPLEWLGRHAYGLFLVHQPLMRDYNLWWHREILGVSPTPITLGIGIILSLTLSVLLAVVIEHAATIFTPGHKAPRDQPSWAASCRLAVLPAAILTGVFAAPAIAEHLHPVIQVVQLRNAPRPSPQSIYDGWSGPQVLRIELPLTPGSTIFPVIVTGAAGRADLLGLRRISEQQIEFVIDHWGQFSWTSGAITIEPKREHTVVISMGSLLPPAGSTVYAANPKLEAWRRRLFVSVDGMFAFDRGMDFHPAGRNEAWIGFNGYGGSTVSALYPRPIPTPLPLPADQLPSTDPLPP